MKVAFVVGFIGLAALYPASVSADFMSLMSSVFVNAKIPKAEEITVAGNSQTMSLLSARLSAGPATTTKNVLANGAMVNDSALTNENSALNGSSGAVFDPYASDRISLYTVHAGDTLPQIAEMYGVSVSTILWANDLNKGSVIKPGQVILILPISGIKYTVKKGDTLASIAKAYKADVDEITRFNDLDSGAKLAVGDALIIPNAEVSEPAAVKPKSKPFTGGGSTSGHMADPSGYFTRPISGGIRTQGIHGRNGVDLASSYGASIFAAADGQVILSRSGGRNGGYGNYIVLQHPNGTQTLYGHLSQNLVSQGQSISKGQVIGKMGSTGDSTGVHLHFEVRGGRNPF